MSGMRGANAPAAFLAGLFFVAAAIAAWAGGQAGRPESFGLAAILVIAGILITRSLMMANQWERAVVLRLGKLLGVRGPGLFVIVPFVDSIAAWIDQRIQTTQFNAEQALTRDTVPANIDAVLFWQVHDPLRAALEITDYAQAISRVAQTSLREMIGSSPLSALLSDRKQADEMLKREIGRKIENWGITVLSVEIRDVAIPRELQDAMSRQAQAEREKEARVILGSAELEVAQKFLDAANIYAQNPAALQLRAMNIVYETTKERGATILIPTVMADAMNPGSIIGLTAAAGNAPQTAAAAEPPQTGPWARGSE
jgi:regulator of protease activity HflC (stomatin/prohibitin superfamily)